MKKFLALILAVVMVLTMSVPVFASSVEDGASAGIIVGIPDTDAAEEDTEEDTDTDEGGVGDPDLGLGDFFPVSDATFIDVVIDFFAMILRAVGEFIGYLFK